MVNSKMEVENDTRKIKNKDGKYDNCLIGEFSQKLNRVLNKIIVKEGYHTYNINKKGISTNGGSYVGVLYEIDIEGETAQGRKKTNIFMKHILNEDNLKISSLPKMFENEVFAYNELSRVFIEIQNDAGIPVNEQFRMAKSYGECIVEAIILENISRKGYKTPDRFEVISLEFAKLSIKALAKFHCLSFAIQKKRPVYFNAIIKNMKTPQIFSNDWQNFLKTTCDMAVENFNDNSKEKLEKVFMTLLDKCSLYSQEITTISCLRHGDYRPNNIMMKEINGRVTDVIPVDYQLLQFGNPVLDFFYFIFLSTDRRFRKDHMITLKNLYYETIEEFLDYFDINVGDVFPRVEFERVYNEKMDFGLIALITFGPFIFADEDNVPDFSKNALPEMSFNASEKFKQMLIETVEDFQEWGYLTI